MFHFKDGLYFGKRKDGSVRIIKTAAVIIDSDVEFDPNRHSPVLDVTIPHNEWESIVKAMVPPKQQYAEHVVGQPVVTVPKTPTKPFGR